MEASGCRQEVLMRHKGNVKTLFGFALIGAGTPLERKLPSDSMRFVEDAFDGGRGRNALFPMEYRFEEEAILAPALEVGVDKSKMLP